MDDRVGLTAPAGVELRLVGGLSVRVRGRTMTFPTRHCELVLAVLALSPDFTSSRERLSTLIWGDRGEVQAKASLRQTLYHLRSAFGEDAASIIVADRRHVRVRGITSDVEQLRHAIDADPGALADLPAGELLVGCGQIGEAFEEWLRMEERALFEKVAAALRAYANRCATTGKNAEAARAGGALLRLDPLDEQAARVEMAALAEMGQETAALSLFSELVGRLDGELGIAPDPMTQELHERIATQRVEQNRPTADAQARKEAPEPVAERRAITIVALAPAVPTDDPEAFAEAMGGLRERVAEALHKTTGRLAGAVGRALIVLFERSESHAIDATALAWRLSAGEVAVGFGVATGAAILTATDQGNQIDMEAAGPLIAEANALAIAAAPGTVVVSGEVAERAAGFFAFERGASGVRVAGRTAARNRWEARSWRSAGPFVGREAELAGLQRLLDVASTGQGRVVALVGDAGIGKTRLVHEFLATDVAREFASLSLTMTERSQTHPFGPIRPFLSDWMAHFDAEMLDADAQQTMDAIVGGTAPASWSELEAAQRRARIIDSVTDAVAHACRSGPLILVVEDMHWVDSETESLLDKIVIELTAAPILIIATYRPEYQIRWIGRSVFELVRLRPLDPPDVGRLISSLGGDPQVLRSRVIEGAGGVPLFVEELVRTYLIEPGREDTPATIADVLSARIGQLGAASRRLLQHAAVLGMETSRSALARLAGTEGAPFDAALDALLSSELLVASGTGPKRTLRFRHAMIHDVAYATLLRRDRRELHQKALILLSEKAAEPATLAHHAEACEDWTAAWVWYRKAGDEFAEITACREARDVYCKALHAHARQDTPKPDDEVDLRLRLHPFLLPFGEHEAALEHLDRAEAIIEQLTDRSLGAAVHIRKSYHFCSHGALDDAIASAKRAATIDVREQHLVEEARLALGQALALRGDWAATIETLTPALPFYDAHPLERFSQTGTRAIWCHGHLSHAFRLAGALDEAANHAERALELAELTSRPFDRVFALNRRGEVFMEREEFYIAAELMEAAMALAEPLDAPRFTIMSGRDLAPTYLALGRADDAHRLLARQEAEARRLSLRQFSVHLALRQAELALFEGAIDEVASHVEAVLETSREAGYLVLETAALRLSGCVERQLHGSDHLLKQALELAEARGLAGEARRARACIRNRFGAAGTI